MTILIDNRSGVPIYNQICQQIRSAILGGELDNCPESAFFQVGTVDDVWRKAKNL